MKKRGKTVTKETKAIIRPYIFTLNYYEYECLRYVFAESQYISAFISYDIYQQYEHQINQMMLHSKEKDAKQDYTFNLIEKELNKFWKIHLSGIMQFNSSKYCEDKETIKLIYAITKQFAKYGLNKKKGNTNK